MSMHVWDEIVEAYQKFGGQQYDISEPITQQQHALQSYLLMQTKTGNRQLWVAALLHDIGHLVHTSEPIDPVSGVDDRHESVGARWLKSRGFSPEVYIPVLHHVDAKRYLCGIDREYCASLSRGSRLSLDLQGGPFTWDQCREFRQNPHFEAIMLLRQCDDGGKELGVTDLPNLETLQDLVLEVLGGSMPP